MSVEELTRRGCLCILFNPRVPHCGSNLDMLQGALIKHAELSYTDRSLKRSSDVLLLETLNPTY